MSDFVISGATSRMPGSAISLLAATAFCNNNSRYMDGYNLIEEAGLLLHGSSYCYAGSNPRRLTTCKGSCYDAS